ncbi:flagellar protein FliO/FliZ [Conyzicola lurida]|uniref:Flagellar protein n=1 Tax=Conyzicola lurida TaxID=1172621 RepID=A0A841ATA3_9MICO|nr:flagellar biosynthetic protein FliO [Conyzicola lurida]MBB5845172.1 flagellar protein FliO/FliZ [Conyzicola lurida]
METVVVGLRVALSLGVVLALLWFLHRRITRGAKQRGPAAAIAVLGKQAVGQKASVVVVDADGMRFVLGVTENNVTVLHSAESPEAVAPVVTPAAAFADVLTAVPSATVTNLKPTAAASTAKDLEAALVKPGALNGSILSPATWRQAASALGRFR